MAGSKGPQRNEYLRLQPITILRYAYLGRTREMLEAIKEDLYFEEDGEADFTSIWWYLEIG